MTLRDFRKTSATRNWIEPDIGSLARRNLPNAIGAYWGVASKELDFYRRRHGTPHKRPIVLGAGGTSSTQGMEIIDRSVKQRISDSEEIQELRQRLENTNAYFRWKAAEVFEDESAVRLLARIYESTTVDFLEFDSRKDGVSLAKLTAAAFCEFSSTGIYITESGQRFIESINNA